MFFNPQYKKYICLQQAILLAMTSIIKTLLQTHKAEIQEQDAWKQTSKVKSQERERYQKFGDQFLQIIIQLMADEDQIQDLNLVKIAKIRSLLLNKITMKHNSQENVVERALGLFIRDSFLKYDQFKKIKQELQMFYEDIDLDSSQIISDDDDGPTISDTVYSSHYPSSIREAPSMDNDFSLIEKWDSEIQVSKNKHQQILQYLKKLSAPASELTYLCQQYGWKNSYESSQTSDGQFATTAIVLLEYKDTRKEIKETSVGQNKKISRMFASAKMLKKIYLSFPRLWQQFCRIKKNKGIELPSTDISTSILNGSKIFQEKIEVLKVDIPTPAATESQLASYIGEISSFKSEINLLTQQLPNYFSPLTTQKQQINHLWKVTGSINFRSQKGLGTKYQETDINKNSKVGEQMVAKKLVTKVYKDNFEIFEMMSMIKRKKGIRS